MLTAYLTQTKGLLQNPSAPTALYSDADLTRWVNIARGQLAGEAECIRLHGAISTTLNSNGPYNFSAVNTGTPATNGIKGIIHVSSIRYAVGSGYRWIPPRSWPWFSLYELNNPVPDSGAPKTWSQFAQGAAPAVTDDVGGGSFYISPVPDGVYALTLDCVCYPIPLADDTTKEAIPYLWTDAVPFFAAYFALLSAQNNARMADAERYLNHYTKFVERARAASNPAVNRWLYRQAGDPVQGPKLQIQAGGGAGAG